MVRPALVRDVPHMHMRTPMHLINKDHYGSWAASQLPITTTALIQPSNQSTCLYRIFLVTSFCPGISRPGPTHQLSLMAGPTGLFSFTSFACATQLRITVPIPFTTLSNYIEQPFYLFSTSFITIWEEFCSTVFQGTVSIDRHYHGVSHNIHRIGSLSLGSARVFGFLFLRCTRWLGT